MPLAANNLASLTDRLLAGFGAPLLGLLPWLPEPAPLRLSEHLHAGTLAKALALPANRR
jgi:hypothetical protein